MATRSRRPTRRKGKRLRPPPKWAKTRMVGRGLGKIGRGSRKAVVNTARFGKWVNDKRKQRLADRVAASGQGQPTHGGNTMRPDRRPGRGTSAVWRHRHRPRWWQRNIQFHDDGSITTTPTPAYTRHGRALARAFDYGRDRFVRHAQRRADEDRRLGRPRDRVERAERRAVRRRERRVGGSRFRSPHECLECPPPLNRFKSAAELNRHFREAHLGQDATAAGRSTGEGQPRGMPTAPVRGRHRAPGRTSRPGSPRRPRVFVVGGRNDPERHPEQDRIKEAVMATGTFSEIAEWGQVVPAGVGEMREDFQSLVALGQVVAEAVETKLQNYRTGAGALNGRPIDEVVLQCLAQVKEAGETLSAAGQQAAQEFEFEYGDDIARAVAADRPEEEWLASGA